MPGLLRSWLFAVAAVMVPTLAQAQTGSIAGRVTDSARSVGLAGAQITVRDASGRGAGSAVSGANGAYRVDGLAAGTYSVLVNLIPYGPKQYDRVAVTAGGTATVDAIMVAQAYQLSEVRVSSVSRVPEKINEAPASITVIPSVAVQERPALSVLDHLKTAPGISFSEGGLVQSNIVSRGFNNIFSGSLLTLIDNRYAAVPSLRVNVASFFPTTNDDVEQIEFVLGPGAALYGPNVTNGVLHIITKSPLTSPGTTVSLEGGVRAASPSVAGTNAEDNAAGLVRFGFRHASRLSPKVGFKVSGEYLTGTDWRYADRADTLSPPRTGSTKTKCTATVTGCRDFDLKKWNGEARIDVKPDENTEWVTSFGMSKAVNMIELTGIGAGQARNWQYQSLQTRFRHKEFFAQVFGNFSNAGETFLLRDGNPIRDSSRVLVAQAQHGFSLGSKETVIYGVDYIFTDARTGGTINGSNEDDDDIKEIGGYVHSVTRLSPKFDVVGALRVDKHSRLESAVWSPRVGLVLKPDESNNLRLTYNRAFSTPSNNNLFLDIAAGQAGPYTVRALGVPKGGFRFRANGGCAGGVGGGLCMRGIPGVPGVPGTLLPANAVALYSVAAGFVLQNPAVPANLKQLLQNTPAPTTQVGTQLRTLNPTTGTFIDIDPASVTDIETMKPSITNAIEFGYKGNLNNKARLSVDVYFERRENFVGPLIVESPTVFLDRNSLITYLTNAWTPLIGATNAAQAAGQIGTAMAGVAGGTAAAGTTGVPLGTVVPNNTELTNRPDIFLTYRNFGSVDLFGADAAFDYVADDRWSFGATYSFVNKDYFSAAEVGGPTDIALNGSKSRGSATVRLRNDPKGWAVEGRARYVKGFPVNSGVYVSPQNPDGSFQPTDSYGVFDLQGSIRPRFGARNMLVSVSVNNVLNKAYATFVGVPQMGRLIMTKVSYTF
ncbi:MAG: TonB-dependent receptor [Gemmatimonadetes bacterium]|nr:TonB-dependent receptor [Gemmatimonadota bacterium]